VDITASHDQNLALTVLYVPDSLDSGDGFPVSSEDKVTRDVISQLEAIHTGCEPSFYLRDLMSGTTDLVVP
jgi:hypothetical protein